MFYSSDNGNLNLKGIKQNQLLQQEQKQYQMLRQYRTKFQNISNRMQQLQQQLQEKQHQNDRLRNRIDTLQGFKLLCKQLTVQKEQIISQLKSQQMLTQRTIQNLQNNNRCKIEQLINEAHQRNASFRSELESIKLLLKSCSKQKQIYKQKLSKCEKEYNQKEQMIKQRCKLLNNQLESRQNKILQLNDRLQQYSMQLERRNQQYMIAERQNTKLKNMITDLKQAKNDNQKKQQLNHQQYQQIIYNLNKRINQLQFSLQSQKDKIVDISSQLCNANNQKQNLKQKNQYLTNQIDQQHLQINMLQIQKQKLSQSVKSLISSNQQLKQWLQQATKNQHQSKNQLSNLQSKIYQKKQHDFNISLQKSRLKALRNQQFQNMIKLFGQLETPRRNKKQYF